MVIGVAWSLVVAVSPWQSSRYLMAKDEHVVIQSYSPDTPAIQYAIDKNWTDFYTAEVEDRKLAKYPPHMFLLKLTLEHQSDQEARETTDRFARMLREKISGIEVLGPSPAFHHKTRTGWRRQLVIKSSNRNKLTHIASKLPPKWQFELDPINLL